MKLLGLNTLKYRWRVPAKCALLAITVLVVCFPNPRRLVRHLQHYQNPNALIEPNAKCLEPWIEELAPKLSDDIEPREALKRVERFVYNKVPYEWDWNTWGTADYLPTVGEVVSMGKEDCDGRAVVAASLLRRFGFKADLVNDFAHAWVRTEHGDTMSPGKKPVLITTDDGIVIDWSALTQFPRAAAYGVAVFPIGRELVILSMLWLLLLPAQVRPTPNFIGMALLIGGLMLIRVGSSNYLTPSSWAQLGGLAIISSGIYSTTKRPVTETMSE
jgi:hypothetical protein